MKAPTGRLVNSWAFLGTVTVTSAFQHVLPFSLRAFERRPSCNEGHSPAATAATSAVDVSEGAPRDLFAIGEWATGCGVQTCDGFYLAAGDGDGRDVFVATDRDLPSGGPILYVPNEMILTGRRAREELGFEAFDAERKLGRLVAASRASESGPSQDRMPQFYLFLKILREYENGERSPYFPWLNSLPRHYSNGASMTDFCFGCLPPYAAELALLEKTRLSQFIMALTEVPFLSSETIQDNDLAKWAFAVVHTRYLDLPDGDVGLVPMADYFNHDGAEAEADVTFDEGGNCVAYATRDVPAGRPLRMCYADPTNTSYLLARYGFLDESCPATFCKIVVHDPSPELVDMGYDPSKMLFYRGTGDVSQEVWDVLLYQELGRTAEHREQQGSFYDAHVSGDAVTKQEYHRHYFPLTLGALRKHVDSLLVELEELSQKNQHRDVERHPRLPLIMRHNEFVRDTFERVQRNLDSMA